MTSHSRPGTATWRPTEQDFVAAANRVRAAVIELNAATDAATNLGLDVKLTQVRDDRLGVGETVYLVAAVSRGV